jgi:hypothetical protein
MEARTNQRLLSGTSYELRVYKHWAVRVCNLGAVSVQLGLGHSLYNARNLLAYNPIATFIRKSQEQLSMNWSFAIRHWA